MKKFIKRLLFTVFAVLLVIQVPFIYRRYATGRLQDSINNLASIRSARENTDSQFDEYKGIIHAHTSLGGHSTGSFEELIDAARDSELDFVVMTEHHSDKLDTAAMTLNGYYGNTLFVGGNEIDTKDGDRFLLVPGSADAARFRDVPTTEFLNTVHRENKLALVTYPSKFRSWDSEFDGIETFSLHTAAKQANPIMALFDMIWSFPAYPELTIARHLSRPNVAKYDEVTGRRRITLSAGTDAHSNIGFHLFGDDAGNKILNAKVDGYGTIFKLLRVHVLAEKDSEFTQNVLLDSLRQGRAFVGLDVLGSTEGFSFTAEGSAGGAAMGDEIAFQPGIVLKTAAPNKARFIILKDGVKFAEAAGDHGLSADVSEPGVYRVEVYLDDLGNPFDEMPWILSNPIYIRSNR
ncbi:MAG: hypothetical protein WBD22_07320 [Pyrinomonadaceae bacterium]